MFTSVQDSFEISNGVRIPCVGYGTWKTPDGEVTAHCVDEALRAGYTHIDTAMIYQNEASVGEGIRRSGVRREDFFLTTKHWTADRGYEKTILACEASLKRLGVDYLDLYLIHWPCVKKVDPNWKEINAETWRGFERLYQDGKVRAIGTSNMFKEHLDALSSMCTIQPMVSQIEFHPGFMQDEVVEDAKARGMVVEAWSPMGSGAVINDPRLIEIASHYGKDVAQLCIRFALDNGLLPLPKSTRDDRIRTNMEVFDFTITEEDAKALRAIENLGYSGLTPEEAPAG